MSSIEIEEGVQSIGEGAFAGCENLRTVILPKSLETIAQDAFASCSKLRVVRQKKGKFVINEEEAIFDLPDGIKKIGAGAFQGCTSIEGKVKLPQKLPVIELLTFYRCGSITSIDMPSKLTQIGEEAFAECESIESCHFPKTLAKIDKMSFDSCTNLSDIKLNEGLLSIGECAFSECGLEQVELPSTVETIGEACFADCKNMGSFKSSPKITTIPEDAFSGCTSLSSIELNNGLIAIKESAFQDCDLSSINIPKTVKSIQADAFANSTGIKPLIILEGIKEDVQISQDVFGKDQQGEILEMQLANPIKVNSIGELAEYIEPPPAKKSTIASLLGFVTQRQQQKQQKQQKKQKNEKAKTER